MGTGKVVTKEDLEKGGDPTGSDTPSEKLIPADQKIDQDGNVIDEEPEKKEIPDEEEKVEPLPKPSDDFKPKHKTWEETEKARIELEKNWTQDRMALSEREKELQQYKKPPEKSAPTIDEKIAEISDATLREIDLLKLEYGSDGKPTPASVAKKERDSAIIWNKGQLKISRLAVEESNRVADESRSISKRLYDKAKSEGFNMDDQDELAEVAFQWEKASGNTTDDKITNAVSSAKSRLERLRGKFVKDLERDKKEKDDLKVLGRGSTRKDTKETKDTKPSTMTSQLAELNEKRRMSKDDLR